jgi:MFS superfamily sulfate permease-like transporter
LDRRWPINHQASAQKGIGKFIPGLALFKGVFSTLLRGEFIVAITVFAVLVPSSMAFGDLAGGPI